MARRVKNYGAWGLGAQVTFQARPLTSPPQSETGTEMGVAAADDHFATTLVQRVVQHDATTGAFVTAERWVAVRAPYGDKYQAKLQWAVWPAGLGGAHLQVCRSARIIFLPTTICPFIRAPRRW
jgi:hypothetical protein